MLTIAKLNINNTDRATFVIPVLQYNLAPVKYG